MNEEKANVFLIVQHPNGCTHVAQYEVESVETVYEPTDYDELGHARYMPRMERAVLHWPVAVGTSVVLTNKRAGRRAWKRATSIITRALKGEL